MVAAMHERRAEDAGGPVEDDGGRPAAARLRTCVATRIARPVDELIRFVAAPDGTLTPDLKAALPGRGVWVTAARVAVEAAVKKRAFARALKREVAVPADLAARVEALLVDRARKSLAMANKAGAVVTGFAKVEAALSRRPILLLHASDGSRDGAEKLDRVFRAAGGRPEAVLAPLTGEQMDLALGRANVVHAAVTGGPTARACESRIRNLMRFRTSALCAMDTEVPAGPAPAGGTDDE
jgi:uncharacterized protein